MLYVSNKKYVASLGTFLNGSALITFLILFFSSAISFAGTSMPSTFTYQGRLMDSAGTAPLAANLTLFIEVRSPTGSCLLYSERQSVNTTTTGGLFSIQIGNGTRNIAQAGYSNDPGYEFAEIFTNKQDFPTVAGSCPGGWTPGATDARVLRIHVYDGSTTTTLADQTLSPVPQSLVADTIDGVPLTGLTLNWVTATRPANPVTGMHGYNDTLGRFEKWNGAAWVPTTPKFSAAVINDTATDNYVLKWNDTSNVWEPSDIGTLLGNPGGDVSGTYGNMTVEAVQGQPVATTAPNLNEVLKWNGAEWEAAPDAGGVVMATGAGTTNRMTKWNASDELADSSVTDDGTNVTFSTPLVMSAEQIKSVANPTDPQDAVTLNYLEQYVEPGTVDGQILEWDNTALAWVPTTAPSAGTLIAGGTQNVIPKFNATGDNIIDSSMTDNGTNVVFENAPLLRDAQLYMARNGSDLLFMHTTDTNTAITQNTFVGFGSGSTSVSGDINSALGSGALSSLTTGSANTAVGFQALALGETFNGNTAFGSNALRNTTGSSNTAVGNQALNTVTTGADNTAIGSGAGYNANSTSTGNIFLGKDTGPTAAGAVSNKLYIDNSANNTPLIYGDFASDYVQINNILEMPEIATPADPVAGYGRIYFKSDGLYIKMGSTEAKLVTGTGAGEVNTASSLGGTASLVGAKSGVDLRFRGLTGSTNITVTQNANDVEIAATGLQTSLTAGANTSQYLKWDGDSWEPALVSSLSAPDGTPAPALSSDNDGVISVTASHTVTAGNNVADKDYVDTAVAAIDGLPAMTDAQIVVSNGTTPTAVTMSGDATISNAGALTIANNAVETAMINDAAVTRAKLAPGGSTGDILKWDGDSWELAPDAGGTSISGGTQNVLSKFNATGDNVVDSSITDSGTLVTVANPLAVNGPLVLQEIAAPTATAGYSKIYPKADNNLYYLNEAGVESQFVFGSGAGEVNTASSLGGTASLVGTKSGVDLRFRGLTGSTNITVTENANDVTIAATGLQTALTAGANTDQYLKWDGDSWEPAVVSSLLSPDRSQNVAINNAGVVTASSTYTVANNADLAHKNYVDTAVAAIDGLPAMTDAQIVVSNGTTPTAVTMSGDATISNTGALTIANNAVETAMINDAAVTRAKLAPGGSTGDILKWDGDSWELAPDAGGTSISGGTQNVLPKFNATGDNIVDSSITDNGTYVLMENPPVMRDAQIYMTRNGSNDLFLHTTDTDTATTSNTFVGFLSANTTVTGAGNTSLGYTSLYNLTSGTNNTSVGYGPLISLTTGNSNNAFGTDALSSVTSGGYNVGLGAMALRSVATGNNNVGIGSGSGYNVNGASSGNIFIGTDAGPTATGAISNKLYIDNSSNNTPLIYGDFTDNYVRINNIMELPEITTPADAATGYGRIYFKTDGLYIKMGSTESKLVTGSGAGEVNTASSLGGTASLVGTKSGVDLRFRGLAGSTNITVTENANDVTIAATGLQTSLTAGANTDQYLKWDGDSWEPAVVSSLLSPDRSQNVAINNAGVITASSTYAVSANADLAHKNYVDTAVAAIDGLPAMTDAQIVVSNGTTPTAVSMSGDATISNAGAVTIAANAVTTGKIANGTILFEDIAANGCTATQTMVRNAGNSAWECVTAPTTIHRTGGNATDNSWYLINTTAPVTIPADAQGNLAIGKESLQAINNASSDWNTAVGHFAMRNTTTGAGNTALGAAAMRSNTTGSQIVAIGEDALYTGAANGNGSVVIGYQAAQSTSALGAANVLIGPQAAQVLTGINNIGVGQYTMALSTSADYNVTLGSNTLYDLTTGDNNTAIGHYAGRYSATTSAANVYIGFMAGPTSSTTESNKLYIDNSANNTPLIQGDFSTDTLTVNGDLVVSMTGKYFNYKPNATECVDGQVMIWVAATDRWICGDAPAPANVDIDIASPFETSVGYQAGNAVAAGGTGNSFFGYGAGDVVSTGDDNVGIGYNAMGAATTGVNNIVIGSGAAAAMTTSSDNIIIGKGAFAANVDGTGSNVVLGSSALKVLNDTSSTNDRYNVAIGTEASQGLSRGSNNTAVGKNALGGGYGTYLAHGSTAVGANALMESNPGEYDGNDAFGMAALEALAGNGSGTQGVGNVGIGYRSLYRVVTGNTNVALGRLAGENANAASSGNVFIGYAAGPTATGAISNRLYIHNAVSNSPLIYGDFSTGSVTINGAGGLTATAYYYSSDRRLKQNISTMESPLEKILKLRAVSFDWKDGGKHDLGFIAQEVEEVMPELVGENEQGIKSVKYGNVVAPLVGAVQELNNMSKMSAQQIAAIDARLVSAERKIASLEEKTVQQQKEIDLLKEQVQFLMKEIKKK